MRSKQTWSTLVKHNAFSILAIVAYLLAMWIVYLHAQTPSLVQTIEMRVGVLPGQTKVIPECGCTVRYLGTKVRGRTYTITLQKLD